MSTGRKGKGEPRLERPEMRERIMQVSAEGMGKENPGKREQKKRKEEFERICNNLMIIVVVKLVYGTLMSFSLWQSV